MTTVGVPLRWLRAAILAAVAGFVGLSGHVYAGGLLPHFWLIVLIYVASVAACAGPLGHPASTARILVLAVGGQLGTHIALSVTGGHEDQPAVGLHEFGLGTVASEFRGLMIDALGEHGLMTFVHLLASILVGLWLALGEQTLWGLLSLLCHVLVVVLRIWFGGLHLPLLRCLATVRVDSSNQLDRIHGSISRRGPPAYALAA